MGARHLRGKSGSEWNIMLWGKHSRLDSYFPSANIYPHELLEEGEPQGITIDRCPDQDRPPVG